MNIDLLKNNPHYIGQFQRLGTLEALPNKGEGDIAYCIDKGCVMIYSQNEWKEIQKESDGLKLQLFDLNKSIISQLPSLSKEKLNQGLELIDNFDLEHRNNFYMLYGKEISYFTIFSTQTECSDFEVLSDAVIGCLENVGAIKSIELTEEKDAIEIWVSIGADATCLYLFPYDNGIVGFGG